MSHAEDCKRRLPRAATLVPKRGCYDSNSMSADKPPRSAPPVSPSLEYSRLLFENILDWYKSADTKAQVVLTLNGVFISFLAAAIFSKRTDLIEVLTFFRPTTWICLSLMALSIGASVLAALSCLWSRLYLPATIKRRFRKAGLKAMASESYQPEFLWFFQHIKYLNGPQLADRLRTVDEPFEIQARAAQIAQLAKNVTNKHWAVNAGFTFFGMALILFLTAAANYLTTV